MSTLIVPAREGRGLHVKQGQRLRLSTPQGAQCADFFAFNAANVREFLSCPHTWVSTFSIVPRQGHVFLSRFRRPMLRFALDAAGGAHDMLITTCDQLRYEFFGHVGHHANCADNLMTAMRRLGYEVPVVPQAVNFFARCCVGADGQLSSPPNVVPPGAYVELEALMDLICVVSACPFDLEVPGWEISSGHSKGLSELLIDVL
jgi:uncharacterized protein YcgI (DUF1989 family)